MADPASATSLMTPPRIETLVPVVLSFWRVTSIICETAPILASASPRNPIVLIVERSSRVRNLLVVCGRQAIAASSLLIPQPLSTIRIRVISPFSVVTSHRIWSAPASMAFSISSFATEAGRSITSPAAIWLIVTWSSWRIT